VKTPKSLDELSLIIRKQEPLLPFTSKTSTVIPFEQENFLTTFGCKEKLVNLSQLPKKCEWTQDFEINVTGPVTWAELRTFAQEGNRRIMTSPTEELAGCLAGLATSCTGELAFAYGNLREQISQCHFMDYTGEIKQLFHKDPLLLAYDFSSYAQTFKHYEKFKNAPFPRLDKATDLMIGTEGQLGVITSAGFKTAPFYLTEHLFLQIPRWEEQAEVHAEILLWVQQHRGKILAVELIDWNSQRFIPENLRESQECDLIFMEIVSDFMEEIFESMNSELHLVSEDKIFQISEQKFYQIRKAVPRGVGEYNSDIQLLPSQWKDLREMYLRCANFGSAYLLFGHFGDCHLHFNFLCEKGLTADVDKILETLYGDVKGLNGTPFAEHGVGLIKKKYMKNFYSAEHTSAFNFLKNHFDPANIFYPSGFMNVYKEAKL
jgi:glycolate oxidase